MINIENVFKSYGEIKALNGITVKIMKNEILGIIGKNGAGKTTLMRIVSGIKKPDQGKIRIMGSDPLKNIEIRKLIGYLPERSFFDDEITGKQFLKIMGNFYGVSNKKIDDLFIFCGIEEAANRKVRNYSKGMVQRLLLAQTMLNNPAILFLDEPNSGIDPEGTKKIRDIILDMHREGKTIVINSHQLTELEKICTRILFLKQGKIVANIENVEINDEYCIEIIGKEENIANILDQFKIDFTKKNENRFIINASEKKNKNEIIKELLLNKIQIETIKKKKLDLEELFFKYIANEENDESNN